MDNVHDLTEKQNVIKKKKGKKGVEYTLHALLRFSNSKRSQNQDPFTVFLKLGTR